MDGHPKLEQELARLHELSPFLIVWGYMDGNQPFCRLDRDATLMNASIREGKAVFFFPPKRQAIP